MYATGPIFLPPCRDAVTGQIRIIPMCIENGSQIGVNIPGHGLRHYVAPCYAFFC